MNIPQPYYNHYGGMIAFGPDGKLYIGKGDGGWEGDPLNAGQSLNVLWGKLLRIDVDTDDDTPYAISKANPFAKADKSQLMSLFGIDEMGFSQNKIGSWPEIWAYGLRNPYMFHFDPKSGDLFIADVGQNHWEEIDSAGVVEGVLKAEFWSCGNKSMCYGRTRPRRPPFISIDRLILGGVCRLFPKVYDALATGHRDPLARAGFRSYWRWKP